MDLKGDNAVVTDWENGRIAILDFGMAVHLGTPLNDRLKMTERYRAPEIFNTKNYLPGPVDIFGIAMLMFTVMCLQNPFNSDYASVMKSGSKSKIEACFKTFHCNLRNQNIDPRAKDIIIACTNPDPSSRHTIQQLI